MQMRCPEMGQREGQFVNYWLLDVCVYTYTCMYIYMYIHTALSISSPRLACNVLAPRACTGHSLNAFIPTEPTAPGSAHQSLCRAVLGL